MSKKEKNYFKNCPTCGKEQGYKHKANIDRAVAAGTVCRSCSLKGKTLSAEHKAKMSAAMTGKKLPPLSAEARAKISASHKITNDAYTRLYGENIQLKRNDRRKWAEQIKERDNFQCKSCGKEKTTPCSIHAHHIVPCGYFPEMALDVSNGVTLCASCHKQIHVDLDCITLSGTKLTPVGFQEHAAKFIADVQSSSQTTQNPHGYKPVFEPMITSHKE